MNLHSEELSFEEAIHILNDADHANKSSGHPWNLLGLSTKNLAISSGLANPPYSAVNATLKDEIRPVGKDARLFRMQAVHDFVEGTQLYTNQNNYMMSLLHRTPMFVKYRTPGLDISRMYESIRAHGGDFYDADGSNWDANFPLVIASIICSWRLMYLPESVSDRHILYYRKMYNGVTSIGGYIVPLIGQPSGHVCTTIDNSLGNIIAMSYVAFRQRIPIETFLKEVLFYCCGDDLIWSDRTHLFTPANVDKYYYELGIFLEFSSLTPLPFLELTFCGTFPTIRDSIVRYHGRLDKLAASLHFRKKKATNIDVLAKYVSACMLSYYSEKYDFFREQVNDLVRYERQNDVSFALLPEVSSYVQCCEPSFLDVLYNKWECNFSLPPAINRCLKDLSAGLNAM